MKLLDALKKYLFPSYYWDYDGKGTWTQGSPDEVEICETLERFFDIGLSPLPFAGRRFRDISRLWVSASPIFDENTGQMLHKGQIIPPPGQESEDEVIDFVRWQFDEGMFERGLRTILSQMSSALITYGRCVEGIDWTRDETPWGEKIFAANILDYNPEFFYKDPHGYQPGIYLKDSRFHTLNIKRLPDGLMMWGTNHMYFENPYGISEMRLLNKIEEYWKKNFLYWARGNERSGVGAYIGKYGNKLLGRDKENLRKTFFDEIKKLKSDTATITHIENAIEQLDTNINDESFKGFHEACGQIISVVLTGSVTALQEGRVGGYSKEEATTTRRKSELEMHDATLVEDIFNYQFIPQLVSMNFSGVQAYPRMQLIEPDLIMPTIPKDQDSQVGDEDRENEDEAVTISGFQAESKKKLRRQKLLTI